MFKKATIKDARTIHTLVNQFAKKEEMLPRSLNEIYENIRDFYICIEDEKIIGVAALHVLWEDLAEIRSVAVSSTHQGKGIAKNWSNAASLRPSLSAWKRCSPLPIIPGSSRRSDSRMWTKIPCRRKSGCECLKCHKFPECNEIAVIKTIAQQ